MTKIQDLLHTAANQARSRGGTTPGPPLSPSVGFNVVSASSLPRSQAPSKPSGKTTSSASPPTPPSQHGVVTVRIPLILLRLSVSLIKQSQPPMSPRRAASQQPTGDLDRAMSPVRSQKSHITGRTRGTEYPPLPTSAFEGSDRGENPSSPLSQSNILRHNKAPSVSPSDSQSQVHVKRMAAARSPPPIEPSHNGNAELSPRSGPRQLANGSGNRAGEQLATRIALWLPLIVGPSLRSTYVPTLASKPAIFPVPPRPHPRGFATRCSHRSSFATPEAALRSPVRGGAQPGRKQARTTPSRCG
jgi:hypothetical protein